MGKLKPLINVFSKIFTNSICIMFEIGGRFFGVIYCWALMNFLNFLIRMPRLSVIVYKNPACCWQRKGF